MNRRKKSGAPSNDAPLNCDNKSDLDQFAGGVKSLPLNVQSVLDSKPPPWRWADPSMALEGRI